MPVEITPRDYSLVGRDTRLAEERGLSDAQWYSCAIPRPRLKDLMRRRDGLGHPRHLALVCPAHRHGRPRLARLGHLVGDPGLRRLRGPVRLVFRFALAREPPSHGLQDFTWMNDALYEIASFMILRESVPWRWSHTRHHTDTIIVGRDPEIAVPRPPHLIKILIGAFAVFSGPRELRRMVQHCFGRLTPRPRPRTFPTWSAPRCIATPASPSSSTCR